jgi:hypothetical protein
MERLLGIGITFALPGLHAIETMAAPAKVNSGAAKGFLRREGLEEALKWLGISFSPSRLRLARDAEFPIARPRFWSDDAALAREGLEGPDDATDGDVQIEARQWVRRVRQTDQGGPFCAARAQPARFGLNCGR